MIGRVQPVICSQGHCVDSLIDMTQKARASAHPLGTGRQSLHLWIHSVRFAQHQTVCVEVTEKRGAHPIGRGGEG